MVDSAWTLMGDGRTIEEGRAIARQLRTIHKEQNNFGAAINAEQLYGESFFMSGQTDSVKHYYLAALDLAIQAKDTNEIVHTEVSLGSICLDQGDFECASSYLESALATREKRNETYQATYILIRQGWMYFTLEDLVLAAEKFQRGYDYAIEYDRPADQANNLMGLATISKKQGHFQQAETYY